MEVNDAKMVRRIQPGETVELMSGLGLQQTEQVLLLFP